MEGCVLFAVRLQGEVPENDASTRPLANKQQTKDTT